MTMAGGEGGVGAAVGVFCTVGGGVGGAEVGAAVVVHDHLADHGTLRHAVVPDHAEAVPAADEPREGVQLGREVLRDGESHAARLTISRGRSRGRAPKPRG